jgi:uncharacterized protein
MLAVALALVFATPPLNAQAPFKMPRALDFANTDWGPQPIRILGAAWGDFNAGNVAAGDDTGAKTVFDLKGKRIAWVVGAPALNQNMTAFLACANLTP